MIRAIFFLFSLLSTASAQVHEPFDELTSEFQQKLIAAQLPYKNLKGSFVIQYNTSAHQKLTIETKPKHLIDSVVLRSIADQIPEKLYMHLDSVHIWSYFKFDDYTNRIFFDKWLDIGNSGPMFNTVLVDVSPPRGKEAFAERWLSFLYQHVPVDTLKRGIDFSRVEWVRFNVRRNDKLELTDSLRRDTLLESFLKSEWGWKPGVRDGRPVGARVSLALPERLPASNISKYRVGDLVIYDDYVIGLYDKPVFFTADEGIVREGVNLISAVNNERKMDAVVYHQGDLKQCQALETLLKAHNPMKTIRRYQERQFDRFYFYTYRDELEN